MSQNILSELQAQPISREVLLEKYAKGEEQSIEAVQARVAAALAQAEAPEARTRWAAAFEQALREGFVPAGRIQSAAGAGLAATLVNCFVQPIGDSISTPEEGFPGIYQALAEAAETMRRGGGVGYDFSRIRPAGAWVGSTQSSASGPVSYLKVFDRSCETVESAGARRGAQMGVLRCDHPDIEAFIHAKDGGELRNFNLSVGVTDAFMQAVVDDAEVELTHKAEPGKTLKEAGAYRREDGQWVYRRLRARLLWDQIMQSTYDHAEPGVLFLDSINKDNNLGYCETITATNPCVTADTWVMTEQGARQVAELVGTPFVALVDGKPYPSESAGFFPTGVKPVFRLRTREGHALTLTADHPVRKVTKRTRYLTHSAWTPAGELQPGDEVLLHDHRAAEGWDGPGTAEQGYLLGLLIGDGRLREDKAILSVWAPQYRVVGSDVHSSPQAAGIVAAVEAAIATLPHRADFQGWQKPVHAQGECRLASAALRDLAAGWGARPQAKTLTPEMERGSSAFCAALLRGLFDADGSVQGSQDKGVSVRLTQADEALLQAAQRLLLRLGVASTLYRERRPAGEALLPDGHGGQAFYPQRALHELVISGDSLAVFAERIGFADTPKADRLQQLLGSYQRKLNRERFVATVEALEPAGEAPVYDVTIADVHAFDANGLLVHNCAEEPLPPYGCCCLGSIDLTRFVVDPFSPNAAFDENRFSALVDVAVRMLDNVLDLTLWPLPQQHDEAMAKRRIGLGFTGLGDALVMLGLRYDSAAARTQGARIAEVMRDAAYRASANLAAERGPFPLFNADLMLAGERFANRLPKALKKRIREVGLRNSHLLAIAPTGTISLAFCDNASNGIEPAFSWTYQRKKRQADGSHKEYAVEDHAYRLFRHLHGADTPLPPAFVSALEISAADHAAMVGAVAPYIDTAISKTVNVPADYPFADFQDLYLQAWKLGLKGLATYRPNAVLGSVLSTTPTPPPAPLQVSDPNQRLVLKASSQPVLASLRWPGRPDLPAGNPGWTFMVRHPHGSFALFIGEWPDEAGRNRVFEVWVNGAEQPRGLGALAKTLSMDLRADDAGWLQLKLEQLATVAEEHAFDMPFPPHGQPRRFPGVVAALGALLRWRCEQLGTLAAGGATPVLDALFSRSEPQTGADGTLAWAVDVVNPAAHEDFTLTLKEVTLPGPDGALHTRPCAMALSGRYPRALDGLARTLSLDMRVVDPAWIGMKLRKLLNYAEPLGDFMAFEPSLKGERRQKTWPSTVAYLARLVIHRYAMLGVLDEQGYPLRDMGVLQAPAPQGVVTPAGSLQVQPGRPCPECGNATLIHKDGCDFCTACGYVGQCG
ncbi:MAG: LAGLIDADG family homing endonuclease [Inhella sp.]